MLDVFTPGELDIDILPKNASLVRDRFWSLVIESDEDSRACWQSFVAGAGSSSHMWAVLRKPADGQ